MDDFLLSAIEVFQGDLEPEGFLTAVLDEIKKKLSLEHVSGDSSASFQSKALAEVGRRIKMEKGLNEEIGRLSKEVSLLAAWCRCVQDVRHLLMYKRSWCNALRPSRIHNVACKKNFLGFNCSMLSI
jgi:hypothetical protein